MEIKELQYFMAVAEAGSFSAAAERLFISQQGLSSAMKRLETELGYPLLIRGISGVTLTERGRAFLDGAIPVVSSFRELVRAFSGPNGKPSISIACAFNLIPVCPKPLQRLLLNQDSTFSVETSEQYSAECEELVENGVCSFGIVYSPFDPKRFSGHALFRRVRCLIVNKKHPFAQKESVPITALEGVPLIIPPARSRTNAVIRQRCIDAGFTPKVALECDRPMEMVRLVKENPDLVARMFEADALAIPDEDIAILRLTEDADFPIDVCLIEKKRRSLTPVEREIRRAILNCIHETEIV